MTNVNPSINFIQGIQGFTSPTQCLNEVIQSWTEYLKIANEEKTRRSEIEAWENVTLAEIKVKRDFLIGYLDCSFDERAKNFQSLFQIVDLAMSSNDNQQLGLALNAIVDLAKSSPFQDLSSLSRVQAALDDPEYIWEL